MRNRNNGGGGGDELPAPIRNRVHGLPPARDLFEPFPARRDLPPDEPAATDPNTAKDLSRLALLFLVVAVANTLFLLVALSFVAGRSLSESPFLLPAR